MRDGLPQGTVTALLQGRDGYIWVGTYDGLARFDGLAFTTFDTGSSTGLASNRVFGLAEDESGDLWIGSEEGSLACRRAGRITSFPTPEGAHAATFATRPGGKGPLWSLGSRAPVELPAMRSYPDTDGCRPLLAASDGEGGLWGVVPAGLVLLRGGACKNYDVSFGAGRPTAIAVDARGAVWVGTESGLVRFSEGVAHDLSARDGLPEGSIAHLRRGPGSTLWALTSGGDLWRVEPADRDVSFTVWRGREGSGGSARIVEERGSGALWLLGRRDIGRLAGEVLTWYAPPDALPDADVVSAAADHEGSLWLGMQRGGLARLRVPSLVTYGKGEGLTNDEVYGVLERRDGSVWVATSGGGVARWNGERFELFTTRDGLPSDSVWSLYEDRAGRLLVGTSAGLARLEGRRFRKEDSLPDAHVLAILEDRSGCLWIGTRGKGLLRRCSGQLASFTAAGGLGSDVVRVLHEDRKGDLWAGTDGGVTRIRDGALRSYTTADGLSDDHVRAIHEDARGALWLGTYGNGVSRLKGGTIRAIGTKDGLAHHGVSQILEDDAGRFWMSSNRGIFRASRAELDAFADGERRSIDCVTYGRADGMADPECNGGAQPAGCRTRDGRLWFPTARGVTVVDPARIGADRVPPPVVIERVRLDGRLAGPGAGATFPPGRGDLEIAYTALTFVDPERSRFRYKLEGFDPRWTEVGTRRVAYYTGLPPGRYLFRVTASSSDGTWNEAGASFAFVLRPRFRQTGWFVLLCVLAGAAALLGAHGVVVQHLRARNAVLAERQRIAREIHDTLGQSLTGVLLHLACAESAIAERSDGAASHTSRARELARECLEEGRRVVVALHPRPRETSTLAEALGAMAETLAAGAAMRVSVDVSGAERRLPERIEHELWHIAQEAITNAIRHSRGGELSIRLAFARSAVVLSVRDDGVGLEHQPRDGSSGAFGLVGLTRERGKRWRVEVTSACGRGTEVVAEARLGWLAGVAGLGGRR